MPGVYTFSDGSTLFQPFADHIGIPIDKVNLVFCMVVSLPASLIYHKLLGNASRRVREVYSLVLGLCFCWFSFGIAIKHLLANILISYALLHLTPTVHVHRVVFLFSMGYLTFIHFYRWKFLDHYSIDVTGPFMVSVQKVTTLSFNLHDGRVKKPEELSPLQKREAISSVPSLLTYLSYLLHYQSILTGPLCFFTDYVNFVNNTHVALDKDGKLPSPLATGVRKLLQSLFFVMIYTFIEPLFPLAQIIDERSQKMNTLYWLFLIYITMVLQRFQYYFAWYFADATYNLSGFGFSGFDEETGAAKWDLATNVDAWKVESAQSFKVTLDGWNCMTMGWLRRVAFDRAPKKYRTLSTYLLSAWWHGLFVGYYVTFFTGAIMTLGGKSWRRSMRWRFVDSAPAKFVYDVITFIGTKMVLAYTTYPFVCLHAEPGFQFYRSLYLSGHIFAVFVAAGFPVLLPPPKTEDQRTKIDDTNGQSKGLLEATGEEEKKKEQ